MSKSFSIGSDNWAGVGKIIEEYGEVLQVLGKLIGSNGNINHWDGSNLRERLEEELADANAATEFLTLVNSLNSDKISTRQRMKLSQFWKWQDEV